VRILYQERDMEYVDFELQIDRVTEDPFGEYRIKASARDAEREYHTPEQTIAFPYSSAEVDAELGSVGQALGRTRAMRLKKAPEAPVATPEQDIKKVETFGDRLFQTVIQQGRIRELYRQSLTRAREKEGGAGALRVRINIDPAAWELSTLPWEFLYDRDDGPGRFVSLQQDISLTRFVVTDRASASPAVPPPLRVLGMVSNPKGDLDVGAERTEIERGLADDDRIEIIWTDGGTLRDLEAKLNDEFHVFHYIGHGDFDPVKKEGVLVLEDGEEGMQMVSAEAIRRNLPRSLEVAVLNACKGATGSGSSLFSSTAVELVSGGLSAVVAMQYEITDKGAGAFAAKFYQRLAAGDYLETAMEAARGAIADAKAGTLEFATPVLYLQGTEGRLIRPPDTKPSIFKRYGPWALLGVIYMAVMAVLSELPATAATEILFPTALLGFGFLAAAIDLFFSPESAGHGSVFKWLMTRGWEMLAVGTMVTALAALVITEFHFFDAIYLTLVGIVLGLVGLCLGWLVLSRVARRRAQARKGGPE